MATAARRRADVEVEGLDVAAYTIPVDADEPESDGTLAWESTTVVVVEAHGGGRTGVGYTYADASAAAFVGSLFTDEVRGSDAMAPGAAFSRLGHAFATPAEPASASWRSRPSTSRSGTSRPGCSSCRCIGR